MKLKISFFILVLSSSFLWAQEQQIKVGDKFFKNFAYQRAIEFYENAIKKGDSSLHVLTRLADCYYNNSNSKESAKWYAQAFRLHKNTIDPEYLYKYSQALRGEGNYQKAIDLLEQFKVLKPNDDRIAGLDYDNLALYQKLASTEEVFVTVAPLPFNSKKADFGAYQKDGVLYFASARDGKYKIYDWNGEPFLDIYQANVSTSNGKKTYESITEISGNAVNTEFHEANIAITNDGQTLYFTRDNVNKKKRLKTDSKGTSHLKIYKASLVNGKWENAVELPFNDKVFSTGHPALSPDNKTLFFVSDRAGGFGKTDLYKVDILEDGTYGVPQNMGPNINTDGKEMFPFVAKDNTFYFSSDSNLNLGFLDIFKSDILNNPKAKPENLGAPFNTGYDDFAFFIDTDTQTGYFASNRPGNGGSDDIFEFTSCSQFIKGTVRDSLTQEPLAMATVKLIDKDGRVKQNTQTDNSGHYAFKAKCYTPYTILGAKVDYKDKHKNITTTNINAFENIVDLDLRPLIIKNEIVINPIYFDFDKWNIRPDAAYELENIVAVMRAHPNMVIKIESHTDSRGSDSYNLKLSDRRAKSTQAYLLSRGIAPERIESAIGYGETQLLNKCSNGVKCTKEEHQLNRRSHFYILKQ